MGGVLVHEWIGSTGGSEKVFEALAEAFPDADLLCLWNDDPGRFGERAVEETWMGHSPFRRHKAAALPLVPSTWRHRKPHGYDWALASSHQFAHHVSFAGTDVPKFAYVYTPARYLWNPELDERGAGWPVRAVSPMLKALDRRRAKEPVSIAAISEFVRARIGAAWDRDSQVIYPPVDVARIQAVPAWTDTVRADEAAVLDALPETYLLGASRYIPYKHLDLVIRAGELCDIPVVLAGSGPQRAELAELAAHASVPVLLVDEPSDALLFALYERALAFVFPPVEDFGIMPVEAMATGCPVVANRLGGASESVRDGVSGALCDVDSPDELSAAVGRAAGLEHAAVARQARPFGRERFLREVRDWLPMTARGVSGRLRGDVGIGMT